MASYLDKNNGAVQYRGLGRLTATLLLATTIASTWLAAVSALPVFARAKKESSNENSTVSATAPENAGLVKETIFSENLEREAYTHLPVGFVRGQRLPAVLVFHGGFNLANRMDTLTGFNEIADQNGFIVCYPQAFKHHWNDGRNIDGHDNYNDEAFAVECINHLIRKYNVDPTRVYACGISNGGFFAQYLALRRPDKVAAIASVAATLPQIIQSTKVPLHPISVLYILGMDDPLMPFDGGVLHYKTFRDKGTVLSAPLSAQYWVQGDHCNPQPTSLDLPDIDATDGCRVKYANFNGGRHGTEVGIFGISGGGHTWPGGLQYAPESQIGKTCRDINASKAIWDFFKNHHN
ncbi:MAG: phospholipase [Cyanobacteria bacterium REEB67]|nr:phospholipase [Cyanobacteria bacterium REEB67]